VRVNPFNYRSRKRRMVDRAVLAYVEWRAQCAAVWDAYRCWLDVGGADAALAYTAYEAALDREEAAARIYARITRRVGHLVEPGLDHPPAATMAPRFGPASP
jgi:hypothetical protein